MLNLSNTPSGLSKISDTFQLCQPLKTYNDGVGFVGWIQSALVDMAMLDYPYPTDYGVYFPGVMCQICQKGDLGDLGSASFFVVWMEFPFFFLFFFFFFSPLVL